MLAKHQKLAWLGLLVVSSLVYLVVSGRRFHPQPPIFPPAQEEQVLLCGSSLAPNTTVQLPTLFFITPTYRRREQVAELTRLSQTLLLAHTTQAARLHWVLAEDSPTCSPLVSDLLTRLGLPHTHLASPMPQLYRRANLKWVPRGVSSRRAGLAWVLAHAMAGVVYFGDDDNTYDLRLFTQMATTKRVSMFPVGFIGAQGVSSPVVVDGAVVGFSDDWFAQRRFPVDMAGFAVNLTFLRQRNPRSATAMPYKAGYEEDLFLQSLNISLGEVEPLGRDCTEVMVWHTKTVKEKVAQLWVGTEGMTLGSSLFGLLNHVASTGIAEKTHASGHRMKTCFNLEKCKTIK